MRHSQRSFSMTPGPGGQFDHLLKNMKSRVDSQESRVENEESIVDTSDSKGKRIEEAKVESRVQKDESRVKTVEPVTDSLESRVKIEESRIGPERKKEHQIGVEILDFSVHGRESIVESQESRVHSLDTEALEEAIEEAIAKPKLGVYSPLAAAMLRYKAITTPRYSMGSEMKTIIERALKETYPELYEEVQKRMGD